MPRSEKLEKETQKEICEWLDKQKIMFWRSNNIPAFYVASGGERKFRSLPKYTPRGLPDIIAVVQGKIYAIEVKRVGEKLKPHQAEFAIKLVENDGQYLTAYSLEDVKMFIPYDHE